MNETELTNTVVVIKPLGIENAQSFTPCSLITADEVGVFNEVEDVQKRKQCTNHIRGCRVVLDEDYSKKKCQDCLRKERESDKRRRDEAKAKQQVPVEDEINRVCTTCCQEYPMEHFQGQRANTTTKTCQTCRENNKKQDSKRDREHRNELARECSKKPEQIARKKEWVENNYDKVAETWQRHRQKQINGDVEQYLRKNADQAKKWREANPDKCAENAEMIKNSIHHQFTTYTRSSVVRGVSFELSKEQFAEIVQKPCYFCGECTTECSINGVDRRDSNKPYTPENTLPCCKMCNMMKNTLNEYTFLKRIEHILTFQWLVSGKLHPEVFCDYGGGTSFTSYFTSYRQGAKRRQIDFDITIEYFKQILLDDDCYICNKPNSSSHRNGIDRFDNDIGYTIENCRVCCFNCNLMKKDYSFDELMRKLTLVYHLHKNDAFENTVINKGMELSNKMSKPELEQYHLDRKEQRIVHLQDRYTNENIQQNAQTIADKRTHRQAQTNPVE